MSVFEHLLGLARPGATAAKPVAQKPRAGAPRPRAEDNPSTDDVEEVREDLEEVKEDLDAVEDQVEDLEEETDEDDGDEPQAKDGGEDEEPDAKKKPAEAKAYRAGRRAGARAERARCMAIFKDKAAGKNPALAASLAFESALPAKQAVAILKAGALTAPSGRPGLGDRMAAQPRASIGTGGEAPDQDNPKALGASIVNTLARLRGQQK